MLKNIKISFLILKGKKEKIKNLLKMQNKFFLKIRK